MNGLSVHGWVDCPLAPHDIGIAINLLICEYTVEYNKAVIATFTCTTCQCIIYNYNMR